MLNSYYPGYMASVMNDLEQLGIDVMMSGIDTGKGVEANAEIIRSEILKLTKRCYSTRQFEGADKGSFSEDSTTDHESVTHSQDSSMVRKVCIYGHSKGAVDAIAALSMYPELCDHVGAFVSAQGPHGASWVAEDLSNTTSDTLVIFLSV